MLTYFLNSIAFTFVSWTIGLILNNLIKNTSFYLKLSSFNFIKHEQTNKLIGLNAINWIIKNSFFKHFNTKIKFTTRPSVSQLKAIRNEMTYAEIGHFIAFIFILGIIILKLLNGQITYAVVLFGFNIIFNLYPSLLQQQNKKRIDRILKR